MLKLRYYDRNLERTVEMDIPAAQDCLAIIISAGDGRPQLQVEVNTDQMGLYEAETGLTIAAYDYDEILSDYYGEFPNRRSHS